MQRRAAADDAVTVGAVRCFLALPLAGEALRAAQELQASLRDRVAGVRWVRDETLHVTVHFFGSIDDGDAERARAAVAPVAARTPPLSIVLDTLGTFPPRGAPRVLWLGSRADNRAGAELATRVRAALAAERFSVDERPFRLHCTLGRPAAWSTSARAAWRDAAASPPVIACTVDRLVLFDSHPGPRGAVHRERCVLPLAG